MATSAVSTATGRVDQGPLEESFREWLTQQENDLNELLQTCPSSGTKRDDEELKRVVEKNVEHFTTYVEKRVEVVRDDPLSFFSPGWCSALERSFLWIAGCRPAMQIRLFYVLSGNELEGHLEEFLQGVRRDDITQISSDQLAQVNQLHARIVKEEDSLSKRLAMLEENVADNPLVPLAQKWKNVPEEKVDEALDPYMDKLSELFSEAEKLRLAAMTDLISILTPLQAVQYLTATRKMHLALHDWGVRKDQVRGGKPRNQ